MIEIIFQELDLPGALPDSVGNIISPIIKIIAMIAILISTTRMIKKHLYKKMPVTRNLSIMFICYFFSILFSSFDILLGWKNLGNENSYVGNSLALISSGMAISIYFWFTLAVFYDKKLSIAQRAFFTIIFSIIQIVCACSSLYLRYNGIPSYAIYNIIQATFAIFMFLLILISAKKIISRVDEEEFKNRFLNIIIGSVFGLISIIFFGIDAFSNFVTIYSLIGWLSLIGVSFFLFKAYL